MSTLELTPPAKSAPEQPLQAGGPARNASRFYRDAGGFDAAVFVNNAKWFIRIRWLAVGVLALTGVLGTLFPATITELGFVPPIRWPWALAVILAGANLCFWILARKLNEAAELRLAENNIWLQILVDLAIVTLLVHIVGSTTTFISFIYLLHVVLACVFFSIRQSLLVTMLAANAYLLCVVLELTGVWPAGGVLLHAEYPHAPIMLDIAFAASAVFIWLVVWYLVSHLAETLRRRDRQLSLANAALKAADQEKNLQVLRTTHDLKAPFSGIESNIHILRFQHWDALPPAARAILENIETRAQVLRERIRDIFILGELRSQAPGADSDSQTDLQAVIKTVIEDLADKAQSRTIELRVAVPAIAVKVSPKPLTMLFANVIANAIIYSHPGGEVEVSAQDDAAAVTVQVRDHGIGIRDEELPHIFEEYYRTREAAEFNSLSTGLGLAIVKEIAQKWDLTLRVESSLGQGTIFAVVLPRASATTAQELNSRA
ncbi:MAG: HAMP domain-containing histidine kinase [Lentisphaerae bacterium]|nr:HAMP domain-containing histidine kinase [Lentisphaerota bacterium]